jgi:Arc/MetJ family transcription regulator
MKRITVEVDETLLKQARRASGVRTSAGAVQKALEEMVRVHRWNKALDHLEELKKDGPLIREGYLAEIRPNAYEVLEAQKKRPAAHERRLPTKKSRARDPH